LTANPITTHTVTVRERNSVSGTIGWVARRSAAANAAIAAADSSRQPSTTGRPNPLAPPSMTPKVSAPSATIAVTWPAGSSGAARRGDRGARVSRASVARPTGRLRKKIARQLAAVVRTPPTTGPPAIATVPPTAHTAMALTRRAGSVKACRTSASDAGSMTAAAQPWTVRPPMRKPSLGARPHAADAATNAASPMPNRRLAPTRSETAPAVISSAANINV
jgi:hypothetical protein